MLVVGQTFFKQNSQINLNYVPLGRRRVSLKRQVGVPQNELHSSLGLRGFDLRENEVTRFLFGGTIPRFTRTWFTRMDLLTVKGARIK